LSRDPGITLWIQRASTSAAEENPKRKLISEKKHGVRVLVFTSWVSAIESGIIGYTSKMNSSGS
jgi:hypothetical protein